MDTMPSFHTLSQEQARRIAVENAWLRFYNRTLYDKGLITKSEFDQMKSRIAARKHDIKS